MEFTDITAVILRTLIIVTAAFFVVRLRGQKQLGQLSLFDTLIIIALGSSVGNVMIYPEATVSLSYALLAIATLAVFIAAVEKIINLLPASVSRMIYGEELVIIYQGSFIKENFEKSGLTEDQVLSHLREKGIADIHDAKIVRLEPYGKLSAEPYPKPDEAAA